MPGNSGADSDRSLLATVAKLVAEAEDDELPTPPNQSDETIMVSVGSARLPSVTPNELLALVSTNTPA
jgi:hypothetical protein